MTPLLPLVIVWPAAVVASLLDGRRRWVGLAAAAVLAAVLAADLAVGYAARDGALEAITGDWPVGVGIRVRADLLSAIFGAVSAAAVLAALLHEVIEGVRSRSFPALALFLAAGLHGTFFTGDAFNFYVFFELAMVSSFALASYGSSRAELNAAFTYMVLNVLGTVAFLTAVAALYHLAGTLDLGQLASWASSSEPGTVLLPGALILAAFSLKLGLFPFHAWAPVVYRDTRPAVAAMLGGALVNVGIIGLLRFGGTLSSGIGTGAEVVLLLLGGASILYAGVLAVGRQIGGEVVAYAGVAHAGWILLALGLGPVGRVAVVLLAVAGALDKTILALALDLRGSLGRGAVAVAAASIAGIPVTVGFLAKLAVFQAALGRPGGAAIVALAVVASALTIGWAFLGLRSVPGGSRDPGPPGAPRAAVALALAAVVIALGVAAEPLNAIAVGAALDAAGGQR